MRLSLVAAAAVLCTSLAAHADTITQNFTASGTTTRTSSGLYGATTSSFAQLNPTGGTLTSISIVLSGTATTQAQFDFFNLVTPASNVHQQLVTGSGGGPDSPFSFTANGIDDNAVDLSYFTGAGTQALLLEFTALTNVTSASGTITYNYTPAAPVAVTPEPSSLVLLGTGVLGVAGAMRRRFAA